MESCRADLKIVQPRREQRAESYMMGLELCMADLAAIPQIWQRFSTEAQSQISDLIQPEVLYRVYTDYSDERCSDDLQRGYLVLVAVEVSSIDNPPENMVGISIPAGDYLVFSASGPSAPAITQTWQQIDSYFRAGSPYRRAFTTDFERYNQQQVEIFVAIQSA